MGREKRKDREKLRGRKRFSEGRKEKRFLEKEGWEERREEGRERG